MVLHIKYIFNDFCAVSTDEQNIHTQTHTVFHESTIFFRLPIACEFRSFQPFDAAFAFCSDVNVKSINPNNCSVGNCCRLRILPQQNWIGNKFMKRKSNLLSIFPCPSFVCVSVYCSEMILVFFYSFTTQDYVESFFCSCSLRQLNNSMGWKIMFLFGM